ncbi:cGMP-dependent 3',5'-cyclic phosphodiesterase [Aix galericulata]|nr:cGMP-dependent 3',5'-cyclic phosphodiesterase [Aix galericulata]
MGGFPLVWGAPRLQTCTGGTLPTPPANPSPRCRRRLRVAPGDHHGSPKPQQRRDVSGEGDAGTWGGEVAPPWAPWGGGPVGVSAAVASCRCSVFLLDRLSHELVAKVFDGGVVDDESYEIRIPADQGIAGHVATTGKILNIKDAYSHPLFYRGVDDSTGFRTRNILCFPIKNESQEVIGVAELVNKINGPWFSKFDEDLATAFSIYCGISIAHSLLYKKVNEAQYRSHLANEMMMYHMKVSDDEYTKLLSEGIQPVATIDPNFASFTYTPRSLPEDDTSMAILSMLQDMNFINTYKMDRQTLTRDIEIFALFISCMCHDLDHRGTNNSFQVASVRAAIGAGGEGHGGTAGHGGVTQR